MPWRAGFAPGTLDHGPIGAFEALAKLVQQFVLVMAAQVEEPFERVQDERLDAPDRQGAGSFAGRGAPHAVGDDDQVSLLVGELRLAAGQEGWSCTPASTWRAWRSGNDPRCCREPCRCRSRHRT